MLDLKKLSKALIPLSLMTMTSAFADAEIADNCCPTPCCPKPCCVPQPKKCIDCECYNPQYYDLQCDWGVFVTADFLYWYARESKLDYAYSVTGSGLQPASVTLPQVWFDITDHHYNKTTWKPGVRVGLGMNMECDGWDLFLNWTYFKTHTSSSVTGVDFNDPANFALLAERGATFVTNPWTNSLTPDPNLTILGVESRVSGQWKFNFNQIDLELGKKYWVSKCFTLRPYAALRGAWIKTNFNVTDPRVEVLINFGDGLTQGPFEKNNSAFMTNKYWGVGLLGGLQPEFMLGNWCGCGNFSIYANVDAALLWGKFKGSKESRLQNTFPQTGIPGITFVDRRANFNSNDHFSRMQGILDLGLGLRWEEHWCCDRYSTSIDLGWEHHYWWNFGTYHRPGTFSRFTNDFTANLSAIVYVPTFDDQITTDLGFGGLVIRFRFDF